MLVTPIPVNTYYTPSSLTNIISNSIIIGETKKMISLRGIYLPGKGQSYNDYYYDTLKNEDSDFQITLVVPGLLRPSLQADKVIEFSGFITKRPQSRGAIEIIANISQIYSQSHSQFSEDDIQSLEIQQEKSRIGYRDVEAYLKAKIVREEAINIVIIVGLTNVIHADIKAQMKESIGFYNIKFHPVNLSSQADIESVIGLYNKAEIDILAISRGGGDNLEMFNKPAIAEKILNIVPLFITAIGHTPDVTLLQKMADKAFITPTALGQFLKEAYNNTKAELENSKAKLIDDITKQLDANYAKQVANLNQQILALQELNQKTQIEVQKNNEQRISNLNKQLEELNGLNTRERQSLQMQLNRQERLAVDAEIMAKNYQQMAKEAKLKSNIEAMSILLFVIIAIIVGIVIGVIFF